MGISNFTGGNNNSGNNGGLPPISMGQFAAGGQVDPTDMLINYNERFKDADVTLFRDDVIAQTMSVLIGKMKPNPLLVGSAGVGKTRIVEDIARRIANHDPTVPKSLRKKTIWELPLANVVAGAGIVGELEKRVTELVDWASDRSNKAVLFIDEIHVLMDDRSQIYSKIAQILKPALARGDMCVIGSTTLQESRSFDDDPAFKRRFSRLIVDELSTEQTTEILYRARGSFLAHYKNQVVVSDDVLDRVAQVADKHSKADQHRPDNALTLLDRTMADVLVQHQTAIANATAAGNTAMVTALTSIPAIPVTEARLVGTALRLMTGHAAKNRIDFEVVKEQLSKLKGQDSVLGDIVDLIRRDELGIFPRKSPTTMLFAGASGVGKTETAKIMAQSLTGQPPIILNMTEYHVRWSTAKIIGSPPGYIGSDSNKELPFDSLESNPHRVILLDEIEKSDKAVQRLFLSAIDEGYIKTAQGKVVDFSKAIIIATTNAARDTAGKSSIGFGSSQPSQGTLIKALEEWFDAEFLARFSKVVAFNPIDKDVYRQVVTSSYRTERERLLVEEPRMAAHLPASIADDVLDELVDSSYVKSQGARPAVRVARNYIEDTVLISQQNAGWGSVDDDADEEDAAPSVSQLTDTDEDDDQSILQATGDESGTED